MGIIDDFAAWDVHFPGCGVPHTHIARDACVPERNIM